MANSSSHFGRTWRIAKYVFVGVYNDGFIHAGNLAYLSLLALFPFFIVAASVASILGQTQDGVEAVNAFFLAVPPNVAAVLRQPIHDVIHARTGTGIVWLGVVVAAWTSASLIETIRDILRRAYNTESGEPFWRHRLSSLGIVLVSVFGAMIAFSAQVAMAGADQFIQRVLPFADRATALIDATRLVPLIVLCMALYGLFYSLTPRKYRAPHYPKWPGALLTALWWYGTVLILPWALSHLSSYDMTYGSLAGVMITLIFFFLVGLGVVIGAELNAALAEFAPGGQQETEEQ
ncbi:MAG: YihY/virulence factor BrkB family protein [Sphingobium sp.]|nr:YihY/virulence factor BrkB family protein [Sphingobium sp.]MBP6112288.1 YihY/virulence factor BrkB family protein [Sphingobium sp.]MBP8671642.1 YihY/virulence factor BrkB family protein [Sphingobium sp.]MBP9158655.1 YihY/virulence factor BrkB family protein [Sphingobium sp.]